MKDQIIKILDNLLSKNITCSIGDIMLQGESLDEGQLTVLSRYYDLQQYQKGDESFLFQNVLSKILWNNNHNEQSGNFAFRNLIKSYEKYGYKHGSRIQLDSEASLMNGSHRVAMNLWFDFYEIEAKIVRRRIRFKRGIQWYLENGLPESFVDVLKIVKLEITKKLFNVGASFIIVTGKLSSEQQKTMIHFLEPRTKEFKLCPRFNEKDGLIVSYSLANPKYYIKGHHLQSATARNLNKVLMNKLKIPIIDYSLNCSKGMILYESYK